MIIIFNKPGYQSKPPLDDGHNFNRISQILLLKQLQTQQQRQQQQQQPQLPAQKNSMKTQSRTRTLSGLKANLMTCNQTNTMLPPRPHSARRNYEGVKIGGEETDASQGDEMENVVFKRNLSLPFKHQRPKVVKIPPHKN